MSLKPMLTGASVTFPPQVPPLIRCSIRSRHTGPSYCPQTCHAGFHLRTFALAVPSACKALHADLCRDSHHSGFRSNGTSSEGPSPGYSLISVQPSLSLPVSLLSHWLISFMALSTILSYFLHPFA